jgi:hypothetical protein
LKKIVEIGVLLNIALCGWTMVSPTSSIEASEAAVVAVAAERAARETEAQDFLTMMNFRRGRDIGLEALDNLILQLQELPSTIRINSVRKISPK